LIRQLIGKGEEISFVAAHSVEQQQQGRLARFDSGFPYQILKLGALLIRLHSGFCRIHVLLLIAGINYSEEFEFM